MDSYFYTYQQLENAIVSKEYWDNGKLKIKTLRYPVNNDQVHLIKNVTRRIWIPLTEKTLIDFFSHKKVIVDFLTPLVIQYLYEKN